MASDLERSSNHLLRQRGPRTACRSILPAMAWSLPTIKTMDVDINGTPVESYTFDTTHTSYSDMGWVSTESFTFTATSASTSLSFVSTTPDSDGGPVIADVGAFAAG